MMMKTCLDETADLTVAAAADLDSIDNEAAAAADLKKQRGQKYYYY